MFFRHGRWWWFNTICFKDWAMHRLDDNQNHITSPIMRRILGINVVVSAIFEILIQYKTKQFRCWWQFVVYHKVRWCSCWHLNHAEKCWIPSKNNIFKRMIEILMNSMQHLRFYKRQWYVSSCLLCIMLLTKEFVLYYFIVKFPQWNLWKQWSQELLLIR